MGKRAGCWKKKECDALSVVCIIFEKAFPFFYSILFLLPPLGTSVTEEVFKRNGDRKGKKYINMCVCVAPGLIVEKCAVCMEGFKRVAPRVTSGLWHGYWKNLKQQFESCV